MFANLAWLFHCDWDVYMTATARWLHGGNPYGPLPPFFKPGEFAYPPLALTWLLPFMAMGPLGYYVWTGLQLGLWWLSMRRERQPQWMLLVWAPVVLQLVVGQMNLAVILLMWAVWANRQKGWQGWRGFGWGLAMALALSKPQASMLPMAWLFWQERRSPAVWRLGLGLLVGAITLALPPTLMRPQIWHEWRAGMGYYANHNTMSGAWYGLAAPVLALAAYLWHRSGRGHWMWWLNAALLPQVTIGGLVAVLPALRPARNYWSVAGFCLSAVLVAPVRPLNVALLLAGQMLAVWLITGGPAPAPPAMAL